MSPQTWDLAGAAEELQYCLMLHKRKKSPVTEKTGVGQKFESLIERKKRKHQESPLPETTLSLPSTIGETSYPKV